MIRIALYQPRIYQDTLSFFFNNTDGFCVVANLNCQNVEKQLKASQPHVILMDIALDTDLLMLSRIRKHDSLIRVVILSEKNDPATLTMCLKMKVSGYLLSNRMELSELAECVRVTCEGGFPMHPSLIGEVVKMLEDNKSPFSDTYFEDLMERQNEILKLIVSGLTYKSISRELCISLDTVRTHIRNIYCKLGVNSKAQVITKAFHLKASY